MEHKAAEARIALENLRASAKALAEGIADIGASEPTGLRAPPCLEAALLRRIDMQRIDGSVMKALVSVAHVASELLRHSRGATAGHPRLAPASRRLEADLCIAAGVLRAIEQGSAPVQRAVPVADSSAQKLGT